MSQVETGGLVPSPGKDVTLEKLKAAYRSIEASDAPEFLKDRVMMDLADRVRGAREAEEASRADGESFTGAQVEEVAGSGHAATGRSPDSQNRWIRACFVWRHIDGPRDRSFHSDSDIVSWRYQPMFRTVRPFWVPSR